MQTLLQPIYNFSAGPAMLPKAILQRAKEEFLDWHATGMSAMEFSHREDNFIHIAKKAEQDLRDIMQIPKEYKVLFVSGGASLQFAMIPMNLLRGMKKAAYFKTGLWSEKAIIEARKYCDVTIVADTENTGYRSLPEKKLWKIPKDVAYVHYTANETIGGVEFPWIPEIDNCPLIADMSSNILSQPIDVSKFGLIYASAQKNIGPAGLTIVIVHEDLIGDALPYTPTIAQYDILAENDSMPNTPPTYSWYLAGLVFEWIKEQGGLNEIEKLCIAKSQKLYHYIDHSHFYHNLVEKNARSRMNIPFTCPQEFEKEFLLESAKAGLTNLKGHKAVGGMRASIYNGMPEEGVDALISFMKIFKDKHA